jgi:hypothetical protein
MQEMVSFHLQRWTLGYGDKKKPGNPRDRGSRLGKPTSLAWSDEVVDYVWDRSLHIYRDKPR